MSARTLSAGCASETPPGFPDAVAVAADGRNDLARMLRQRPVGGMRFAGTGQILDLPQTLQALRQAFLAAGGSCIENRVQTLEVRVGHAEALLSSGERHVADLLVVAQECTQGTCWRRSAPGRR